MSRARPPTAVLSEALREAIGGRTVRVAVFTTFSFDPAFFEEQVLPDLFDQPFHAPRKIRLIQLEDAFRRIEAAAVYYDRRALAQEALPARLDVRRLDVSRRTGYFHPKVILLLVDEDADLDDDEVGEPVAQSLVIGITSANLTRSGWWESVEAFHFEELPDKDLAPARCPFRTDLLSLILQIRRSAPDDEDHEALDRIRDFIKERTPTGDYTNVSARGAFYTRIFCGQESLAEFLGSRVRGENWRLDVISPFFDGKDARTLDALLDATRVGACRVFLPEDAEGRALVSRELYDAVGAVAEWACLPTGIVARGGRLRTVGLLPRGVHAKVYRFWRDDGAEAVLLGSPNLTVSGHSAWTSGNLEAAFFADTSPGGALTSWLQPLETETEPEFAEETPDEGADARPQPIDISLRFDWSRKELAYRLHGEIEGPLVVADATGRILETLPDPIAGSWQPLGPAAAEVAAEVLHSSSFLLVRAGEAEWRVLVREEGMTYRPSLLTALTPEEILLYWSLLTPQQRSEFVAEKLQAEALLEGLPASGNSRRYAVGRTVFDRFAGLFHAFECLRRHVDAALGEGGEREAELRLFGEKYDSLPVLLEKVLAGVEKDPVHAYLTFLCARQVRDALRGLHPDFFESHQEPAARLEARLALLPTLRDRVPLDADAGADGFLEWYEEVFLAPVAVPEEEQEA